MMALIQLLIAILATYRLAHFLSKDDGPFFFFTRIRSFITFKREENPGRPLGFWASADKWAECPYCQGIYIAPFCVILALWQNDYANIFLLILAIAGGQSLLQEWSEK